jgi:transposase
MIKLDRTDAPAAAEHATVYLAFELSKAKWKLGVLLPGSQKLSRYTIAGGDLTALATRLADMRKKAATAGDGVWAAASAMRPARMASSGFQTSRSEK